MVKTAAEIVLIGAVASVFIVATATQGWPHALSSSATDEEAAKEYMTTLDNQSAALLNQYTLASWNYEINITDYNAELLTQTAIGIAEKQKALWTETTTYSWEDFGDEDLKRKFKKYSLLGYSSLPIESYQKHVEAITAMKTTYSTATICDYTNSSKCDLYANEVAEIFASSDDPEELKYAFLEWHKAAGAPSKENFKEYVELSNEAAKFNGFNNVAEWWLSEYEADTIEDDLLTLWQEIKPFYEQLHAYVRNKLRAKYGEDIVSAKGPIPTHLLGNIWGQSWDYIAEDSLPFPNKIEADITAALVTQNYTALKFFQSADEFFTSLGLLEAPALFWEKSVIERLDDGREMSCGASAWDFRDGKDYRIRQCTKITNAHFTTAHHEMGHIQYYLQYKDQPDVYRSGANPGFHEAVGDVIALSVSSNKHLRSVGLLTDVGEDDYESTINHLYKAALSKIAFPPFAYLLDVWRYSVFRGTTTPDNYNCHYWQLKDSIQGLEPPAPRSEEDFDPAAKLHVSYDVEYMRYYISYIVQFQFHQALCEIAGQYSSDDDQLLSDCDIYNNKDAGSAFGELLQPGSSKPWQDTMETLTGTRKMDTSGLMAYFQPLYDWLVAENERTGEYIGWEASNVEFCTSAQLEGEANTEFQQLVQSYRDL